MTSSSPFLVSLLCVCLNGSSYFKMTCKKAGRARKWSREFSFSRDISNWHCYIRDYLKMIMMRITVIFNCLHFLTAIIFFVPPVFFFLSIKCAAYILWFPIFLYFKLITCRITDEKKMHYAHSQHVSIQEEQLFGNNNNNEL